MINARHILFGAALVFLLLIIGLNSNVAAQARKTQTAFTRDSAVQKPMFTDYKGVRLGMTAAEAREKLGIPQLQQAEQEYYEVSETERVQIAYNPAGKIVTISVDYMGGTGAPDYKAVVGGELQKTLTGGLYKMERYESAGYWVSYNRTAGPVVVITITMQKM